MAKRQPLWTVRPDLDSEGSGLDKASERTVRAWTEAGNGPADPIPAVMFPEFASEAEAITWAEKEEGSRPPGEQIVWLPLPPSSRKLLEPDSVSLLEKFGDWLQPVSGTGTWETDRMIEEASLELCDVLTPLCALAKHWDFDSLEEEAWKLPGHDFTHASMSPFETLRRANCEFGPLICLRYGSLSLKNVAEFAGSWELDRHNISCALELANSGASKKHGWTKGECLEAAWQIRCQNKQAARNLLADSAIGRAKKAAALKSERVQVPRLSSTATSRVAVERMESYLRSKNIGLSGFAKQAKVSERTLRNFRKTGKIRRSSIEDLAKAMNTTKEALLESE